MGGMGFIPERLDRANDTVGSITVLPVFFRFRSL